MISSPKYAKIKNKLYKINTSYKVGLKCDEVIKDSNISDYEKMLAIIYLVFGDDGLKDNHNHERLIELALKYLSCGEEIEDTNEKPSMDFNQDFMLIKASFMSDYGIDLSKQDIDWQEFYTYINGLTNNCILNRIRELRECDTKDITDPKEKRKIEKAKKRWALKNNEHKITEEQKRITDELYKAVGL